MQDRIFDVSDVVHWHATAEAVGRHGVIRPDGAGGHVLWSRQHDLSGTELFPVARLNDAGLGRARALRMPEWDI